MEGADFLDDTGIDGTGGRVLLRVSLTFNPCYFLFVQIIHHG
jgi:hypothetical protein